MSGTPAITWLLGILPALLCGALTYVGLKLLVPALEQRAILDHPEARSNHSRPTPRGGGLAVIISVLIVWPFFASQIDALSFIALFAVTFLLTAVSFLDDMRGLGAGIRFATQIVAVLVAAPILAGGAGIVPGLPLAAELLAIGFLWLWFINLFNFMDGIDGLAGIETITIAVGVSLCLMQGDDHLGEKQLALAIAGGAAVFLFFNWHPARVFLGDSGSIPLGFLLGGLLVAVLQTAHWAAAIILPAYYWIDSGFTILARLARRETLWRAHSSHAYQRAVRGGWGHDRVTLAVAAFNLAMVALAYHSPAAPVLFAAIAIAGAALLFFAFGRIGRGGSG